VPARPDERHRILVELPGDALIEFVLGRRLGSRVVPPSSDRHIAEISRLPLPVAGEVLLEITSSGMNSAGAGNGEANRFRALPDNVRDDNFATIAIDWREGRADVELAIRGVDGTVLQRLQVRLPQGARSAQTQLPR
jgi:alkaline phosphatase D